MATGADLKIRLEVFLAQQERSLAELENRYLDEKVRLTNQIAAAKRAIGSWDARADVLLDALDAAGIQIRTE